MDDLLGRQQRMKLDGGKVGSFDGDVGEFFGREVIAGKDVIVKFHWDKRNPKTPIYSRAFSADAGRTWEWNWYRISHHDLFMPK